MSSWGKGKYGGGKGGKGKGSAKGKGGAPKREYAKKVPWESRLSKWYLRPYVDQAGSPFTAGQMSESELLSTLHLTTVLGEATSEYCARQGVALSEGAANFQVGAGVLQHHFAEGHGSGLAKTGIESVLELLDTPDGRKFLQSCAYLNAGNSDVDRSEAETTVAVRRFLRFLTTQTAEKEAAFKKALRFSARLYLFAFEGLEALAALNNPRVMAAGVQQIGQQVSLPQHCKDWLCAPDDPEALLWGLVAAFQQQKVESGRKRQAQSYEWDEEEAPAWTAAGGGPFGFDEDEAVEPPKKKGKGDGRAKLAGKPRGEAFASDAEGELGDLDLASSPEAAPEAPMDISGWPKAQIAELSGLLADVVAKSAKDRPSLHDLQAALGAVPEALLKAAKLQKIVADFVGKSRYPRTESLKKFVLAVQDLVARALAAAEQD